MGVLSDYKVKHPHVVTSHISLSFQVFGDYYHFRHRTVVKRSLSDHRGTQVRLQKDPRVRSLDCVIDRLCVRGCGWGLLMFAAGRKWRCSCCICSVSHEWWLWCSYGEHGQSIFPATWEVNVSESGIWSACLYSAFDPVNTYPLSRLWMGLTWAWKYYFTYSVFFICHLTITSCCVVSI